MDRNADKADKKLSQSLREWNPSVDLPPRFESEVWRRISERKENVLNWDTLVNWLTLPRFAVSLSLAAVMLGVGFGLWQAQNNYRQAMKNAEIHYLHSVDPFSRSFAANP